MSFVGLQAAIIDDFQSDTAGSGPTGWFNDNNWTVQQDPADAGNLVLGTDDRAGNTISGTTNNATIGATATEILAFDFYFIAAEGDIGIGMTELSDLSTLGSNDSDFFGPLIRFVDGGLSPYDGNGSGSGGSYEPTDQSIATGTWYTLELTINNQSNVWSGTIVGGAFGSPTQLTANSGALTSFGFRTDGTSDLVTFAMRANNNNNNVSNGLLIDNISIIPEPSTTALIVAGLTVGMVALTRRRRS